MRPGTGIYRTIGRLAAWSLSGVDGVIGVYARRSAAMKEVAIGRSDVDLHILIAPPASLEAEGRLLLELFTRFRRVARVMRVLDDAWVSTPADLDRWYREQPVQWYRDRGWLRLWGEEFERPREELDGRSREDLLWWYFWAAWNLPENVRAGNARRCCNLLLDMFDAYRLYTEPGEPLGRAELIELWWAAGPATPEREAIRRGFHEGFDARGEAVASVYRASLALHDAFYERIASKLGGRAVGKLESRVPPHFIPRTYALAEAEDRAGVNAAFELMRRNPSVWLLNERGLKLYLLYRNPWEYAAIAADNPGLELERPPEDAFIRTLRYSLFREIPRFFGFMSDPGFTGPHYAQRRLYAADRLVAVDAEQLAREYARRFGEELQTDVSLDEYFLRCYPEICNIIDELRSTVGAGAPSS